MGGGAPPGRAQAAAGLCDRVLVILVVLRFQLPHQALAVLVGVDRATLTRAVHEVRPLLARRGLAVPGQQQPGVRLRRLADVFAYADASETQVRRPRAHRPGRRAFVSGKRKQNTIKMTTCSDGQGRTLWSAGRLVLGSNGEEVAVVGIVELVNVGRPRAVEWRGQTVMTAIWKAPVAGRMVDHATEPSGRRAR